MASGTFIITDGYTSVDILNLFCLVDWTPATPPVKNDGTWRSSPFSQGRQQVLRQYDNVIDTLTLIAKGRQSADQLIRNTQDLRRLLEKAASYWLLEWQNEPVWIETRGICETNTRYAVIHDYRAPNDDNPFAPPYTISGIFDNFQLIIEHGIWQDAPIGSSNCVEVSGYASNFCFPHYLVFDGTSGDNVNCGSDALLDDLPSADFTLEAWVYATGWGGANIGRIITKTGNAINPRLIFSHGSTNGLEIYANFDVTDANSRSGTDDWTLDNQWHHVAAVFNSTTKVFSLFIDGVEPTYSAQVAGANNYVSDAAEDFIIGNNSLLTFGWEGYIGWTRVSDNQRYTADFPNEVPARCKLPDVDSATVGLWIYEGTGATAHNKEGAASIDGAITTATWDCDCEGTC